MGELVVVFKIMPESVESDLAAIETAVRANTPEGAKIQNVELAPVAFGLKSVNVTILMEDETGAGPDALEEAYGAIPDVASVRITDMGRV